MILKQIRIRNFRLLRHFSIDLVKDGTATDPVKDGTVTVLVGPNNSGKTSVMEALRVFLSFGKNSRKKKVAIHDFSQKCRFFFRCIQNYIEVIEDREKCIEILRQRAPRIRMDLIFRYDENSTDLAVAADLLMNLDPKKNIVGLRIEYSIKNANALIEDFKARRHTDETLFQFISDELSTYYDFSFCKISEDGTEVEPLESNKIIGRLIKVDMISAQRFMDDEESSRAAKLSKLLHDHYNRYYQSQNLKGYNSIEDLIKDSAAELTEKYQSAFERLTTSLQNFGYPPGHKSPRLSIKAEMTAESVYRDNTRVFYKSEDLSSKGENVTFELPERYNGLGYKNLIYIVLQLESFRAALEALKVDTPRTHIIAIEEPEAHLHPQMQCIFIREISKALGQTNGSNPQVILSTHSSHIVADSGFKPIRYFKRKGNEVSVKDLSRLVTPNDQEDVLRFLRRYVKLTHCDLFFADKAILVEGQVERLLLPLLLEKCSELDGCENLTRQYISVSVVGGAYAHKLQQLVNFIGIPTLIVTDIDTVDENRKKCPVSKGKTTSNYVLKNWIPAKSSCDELLEADDSAKTVGLIRIAYQTFENDNCGRSFEEAFIYANLEWLKENHTKLEATSGRIKKHKNALADKAYKICDSLPKVEFALDLITVNGWAVPAYIKEGLQWLAAQEPA